MTYEFNKNKIEMPTATLPPLVTVHVYTEMGFMLNGNPVMKYITSVGFTRMNDKHELIIDF